MISASVAWDPASAGFLATQMLVDRVEVHGRDIDAHERDAIDLRLIDMEFPDDIRPLAQFTRDVARRHEAV